MRCRAPVLLFLSMRCAWCQDAAEQQQILSRIREAAIGYEDRLQDFTCTQFTTRSAGRAGRDNQWKPLETQESDLSYVGHREIYKLLKVDGDSKNPEKRVKRGYTKTSGEFGSVLKGIFAPKARAELTWDHVEASGQTCVVRYRVDEANSSLTFRAGSQKRVLAHHGTVYADCATGMVTRIHFETDPDPGRPGGFSSDIVYGLSKIGSKEFLLPQSVEDISSSSKTLTKIEIRFENYRKYDADSAITFQGEAAAPDDK